MAVLSSALTARLRWRPSVEIVRLGTPLHPKDKHTNTQVEEERRRLLKRKRSWSCFRRGWAQVLERCVELASLRGSRCCARGGPCSQADSPQQVARTAPGPEA